MVEVIYGVTEEKINRIIDAFWGERLLYFLRSDNSIRIQVNQIKQNQER